MLYALENRLLTAVASVLPEGVQVRTGPSEGAPPQGVECVELGVSRLSVPPDGEEPLAQREPAFLTEAHQWSADGVTLDFTLPEGVQGALLEVESPAGHPARLGEDYQVDGRTVRFYRPPAQGLVVALVQGSRTRGYRERRACEARLEVRSWAEHFPRADELLDKALAAVLAGTVGDGTLETEHLDGTGVRLRLLQPEVLLEHIERTRVQAGTRMVPSAVALLRVMGHLEVTVAVGTPAPGILIGELGLLLRVRSPTPDGGTQEKQSEARYKRPDTSPRET